MFNITIKKLQAELHKAEKVQEPTRSFTNFFLNGDLKVQKEGEKLLAKSALLVLAGGSGSRLRFERPKGCFPISNVKNKSLFEILADKVKAASKLAGHPLEMAIMTSPLNRVETEAYFENNNYFGLDISQVHFFCQDMWPLLNLEGEPFFESPGKIGLGPNGNGGALKALYESPIYERWKKQGIEIVNVVPIDNPLSNPFDTELFGFHVLKKNEITTKATRRKTPKEKVGVIVDGPKVIEYGDARLIDEENALAYIGLFCVDFSFIERAKDIDLPLHKAKKTAKFVNEHGEVFFPKEPNVWKFELFLFDIFEFSKRIGVICYPREECFAPLKNFDGEDSILTVKAALLEADRKMFQKISGIEPSKKAVFELSQEFYFPTTDLLKKWQGQELPKTSYIDEAK